MGVLTIATTPLANRPLVALTILGYRAAVASFFCSICLLFRHHLFVWSVFAPKLVYEMSQLFVQSMIVVALLVSTPGGALEFVESHLKVV